MTKVVPLAINFPETADIETSSGDYARRFSGGVGLWFLDVQAKATLQMLTPYPKATILDVGGGHGQLTSTLVENGYQTTVLGSAEICRMRIRHYIDQHLCQFKVGNILDLPYADKTFDVVISYRLLPHVSQWQAFLAELTRAARQAVIIDYPELRSVNYIAPQMFRLKKQLEGNTREFTCFRRDDLLTTFRTEGFVYQQHYAEFFLPMVFHRTLKSPKISAMLEKMFRLIGLTNVLGSPVILKLVRNDR